MDFAAVFTFGVLMIVFLLKNIVE